MSWKHIQGTWQLTPGRDHRAWWGLRADLSETKEIGVSLDRTERQLGSLFVLKHKENFESHWYLKWIRAQRLCKNSKGEQRRQLLSSCGETAKSILVNMVVFYIKFLNLQQPKGQVYSGLLWWYQRESYSIETRFESWSFPGLGLWLSRHSLEDSRPQQTHKQGCNSVVCWATLGGLGCQMHFWLLKFSPHEVYWDSIPL